MALVDAPTVRVLVTFTGTTETDITSDVLRITIGRGRSREREVMSPGHAELLIWNLLGKYDPDNVSGPYFPNIRPNKKVRLVTTIASPGTPFTIGSSSVGGGDAFGAGGSVDVPLYTGRLEGGIHTYEEGGLQPKITWRLIDASKRLNRDRSTTGYGTIGEPTGDRVQAVLEGASPPWSSTEFDIMPGLQTVQVSTGDSGRYDYLQVVAASESGAFFIGKDGRAIFRDSSWAPATAGSPIGSGAGEFPFSTIEITDEDQEIFNAVTVSAPSQSDQVAEDSDSQGEFGRADLPISTILQDTGEMLELAQTLLDAYSQPRRRISKLRVDRVAADWSFFLGRELLDRVLVRHRPIYGGLFEQLSVIQGITIEINDSQNWVVTWNLSPPIEAVSPNLLNANQASMESSAAGWTSESDGTIIWSSVAPISGTHNLLWQPTASTAKIRTTPTTGTPVTVGVTYKATGWIYSLFNGGAVRIEISWRNSGGSELSTTTSGIYDINWDVPYQQMIVQGVAPASAAFACVRVKLVGGATPTDPVLDAFALREV